MMPFGPKKLEAFVTESNRIEGIDGCSTREVEAHRALFARERVQLGDMIDFVLAVQPDAELRMRPGLDVTVGSYTPPAGGEAIRYSLHNLLERVYEGVTHPWNIHRHYEELHPFTDGNGRSGRALWAWQMIRQSWDHWGISLGFLHAFYYQTLMRSRISE